MKLLSILLYQLFYYLITIEKKLGIIQQALKFLLLRNRVKFKRYLKQSNKVIYSYIFTYIISRVLSYSIYQIFYYRELFLIFIYYSLLLAYILVFTTIVVGRKALRIFRDLIIESIIYKTISLRSIFLFSYIISIRYLDLLLFLEPLAILQLPSLQIQLY